MHWGDEEVGSGAAAKTKKRFDFGVHYTSEGNIQRAIRPLFVGPLLAELGTARGDPKALTVLHEKLRHTSVLDPACG